jgi:pyridinium-3,5-biscarboxylic acid mononucleotide sulfurtransferase
MGNADTTLAHPGSRVVAPAAAAVVALNERLEHLKRIVAGAGPSVVAFSGGVDSAFLLRIAHEVLRDQVLAVTAVSPSLAEAERHEAIALAAAIGVEHRLVATREMDDPGYVANAGRRCYHCKRELFRILSAIAPETGGRTLLYGAIPDDLGDDRPGLQAAAEAGARAPLCEAGITKAMVREFSRALGLPTWDKPAMACLASRIPVHTPVTVEALASVDRAEAAVRRLGYRQVRVRHHGSRARVELDAADLGRALAPEGRDRIVAAVRAAGYAMVEVDPRGYRTGGQSDVRHDS